MSESVLKRTWEQSEMYENMTDKQRKVMYDLYVHKSFTANNNVWVKYSDVETAVRELLDDGRNEAVEGVHGKRDRS